MILIKLFLTNDLDLEKRTQSDIVLKNKAFKSASNPK